MFRPNGLLPWPPGRVVRVLAGFLVHLSTASCSGDGGPAGPDENPVDAGAVANIQVSPGSASLAIGGTQQFVATATDQSGNARSGASFSWSSSAPAIALVSSSGLATGVAEGSAEIRATVGAVVGSATLTVLPPPGSVTDLTVAEVTDSSATLQWTQVSDGTGTPAKYALRLGSPTITWAAASTTEVSMDGTTVGAAQRYLWTGLQPGTVYEFQLVAYRGTLNVDAVFGSLSNTASATLAEAWTSGDFPLYSTLYGGGSSFSNTFVALNNRTGAQHAIGAVGATPHQLAMDRDPISGDLFGVDGNQSPGVVTRIDPTTGADSVIATAGQAIFAIAFSPGGDVYVVTPRNRLSTLDLATGQLTSIGEIPPAGSDSSVYAIDFSPEGVLWAVLKETTPAMQFLITVDPGTAGITSSIPLTGDHNYTVGEIDFAPDGYIYGTNFSWLLLRIDPGSGVMEGVGHGDLGAPSCLASGPG